MPPGALAAGLLLAAAADANAQIYRCEGAGGVVEYSNARPAAGRNCRPIKLPSLTTIPAGQRKPAPAAAPAGFPKVDPGTQKRRDDDRLEILAAELEKERARLASLKAEYKDGKPERLGSERNYQRYLDRVARLKADIDGVEGNVAALEREIAALRR